MHDPSIAPRSPSRLTLKYLIALLVLAALSACSSEPPPADPVEQVPAVTEIGTPNGPQATVRIGPAGGTAKSADGQLELVIPPNALSADTEIGVMPITATAPGGRRAYRLSPEGTTFAQPATVKFTLSSQDLEGTAMEAIGIAFQDTERHWEIAESPVVQGNSIEVKTAHFSDWSVASYMQLRALSSSVQVGKSVELNIELCEWLKYDANNPNAAPTRRLVAHCFTNADNLQGVTFPALQAWSVNGKLGGDATVGRVVSDGRYAGHRHPDRQVHRTRQSAGKPRRFSKRSGRSRRQAKHYFDCQHQNTQQQHWDNERRYQV